MLLADYGKHLLLPEENLRLTRPPAVDPQVARPPPGWLDACKTGAPTTCDFDYAGWLTEANHLGNVASIGQRLEWDPENLRATNTRRPSPSSRASLAPAGASGSLTIRSSAWFGVDVMIGQAPTRLELKPGQTRGGPERTLCRGGTGHRQL